MTEERIRYLFHRYFMDSCTEGERLEFHRMVDEGAHDEVLEQVIRECWDEYAPERMAPVGHVRQMGRRSWLAAAAALVLACVASLFLLRRSEPSAPAVVRSSVVAPGGKRASLTLANGRTIMLDSAADGKLAQQGVVRVIKLGNGSVGYEGQGREEDGVRRFNTISTPNGGQYQVTLTDGTKVWLNAASTLVFPTAFQGGRREVTLKGEGYFEVARNLAQPFVVRVQGMAVNVLGTHFNIMAYDEEDAVRTTLLEGAVQIDAGGTSKNLAPGQQGAWNKSKGLAILSNVDVEEAVAWKNGLMQFNSAGIQTVMRQIARWYDVQIVYDGDVKDEHFSGSIPANEQMTVVLKMLEMTNTIRFDIKGRTITVRNK